MSEKIISYESLDGRMAPEALTRNNALGLSIVDGHAVKNPGDYEDPDRTGFEGFCRQCQRRSGL